MLGSGICGYTRNPGKKLKSWTWGSDADLAIFSRKISRDCIFQGVQVNRDIQLHGRFILFKNIRNPSVKGIGFFDTPIGRSVEKLQEYWCERLYGEGTALGFELDFKVNIDPTPFKYALDVYRS
jgi:hypothetical protein